MKIIYRVSVEDRKISRKFQDSVQERMGSGFHLEDRIGQTLLQAIQFELPLNLQDLFDVQVNVEVLSAKYGSWEIVFAVIAAISAYHDLAESLELMRSQIAALIDRVLRRNGYRGNSSVSLGYVVQGRGGRMRIPQSVGITSLLQVATIVFLIYMLNSLGKGPEKPPIAVSFSPVPTSFECTPVYPQPTSAEAKPSLTKDSQKNTDQNREGPKSTH